MTDNERTELEGLLAEARAAYHRLQIGEAETAVNAPGGRGFAVSPAKAQDLRVYIAELEARLGLRQRRCLHPTFR